MNYQQFRAFRDETLLRQHPLRLDCMNPVKALDHLVSHSPTPPAHKDDVAEAWERATGYKIPPERRVLSMGVRPILQATLCTLASHIERAWLPEDVYPAYWTMAQKAGISAKAFNTTPTLDWAFLKQAGDRDLVLIPSPLSPAGRSLTPEETTDLSGWLKASSGRWALIDAVYTYDYPGEARRLGPLLATGRCLALWSLSKGWLRPSALGIADVPVPLAPALREKVPPPLREKIPGATKALRRQPDLPVRQQRRFDAEWKLLLPRLSALCPGWLSPATGYFSAIPLDHQTLLDRHGILAVPISVFGSDRKNLSVITCLHDLRSREVTGAAS